MPSDDKPADHRRINKPIMEKRRRARINDSLTQLKSLVLEGMKKDPARHSKLEKADILEMAVKHLRSLQARPERALGRYRDGYVECRREVVAYLSRDQALDGAVKQRLLTHLRSAVEPAALGAGLASLQLLPGSLSAGQIAFIVPGVVATAATAALDVHTMLPLSVATQPASVGSPSPVPSSLTEHTWDPAEPSSPASPSSSVGSSGSSVGSSDSAPSDSPRPLDLVAHSRSLDDACWRPW